jgi:hypothetical protein
MLRPIVKQKIVFIFNFIELKHLHTCEKPFSFQHNHENL